MIIPNKNIKTPDSLLGIGSWILLKLMVPQTISSLWDKIKKHDGPISYEKFILTLDMLYVVGLIELREGIIRRTYHDKDSSK